MSVDSHEFVHPRRRVWIGMLLVLWMPIPTAALIAGFAVSPISMVLLVNGLWMFALGAYLIWGIARMRTLITPLGVTASGFRNWHEPLSDAVEFYPDASGEGTIVRLRRVVGKPRYVPADLKELAELNRTLDAVRSARPDPPTPEAV